MNFKKIGILIIIILFGFITISNNNSKTDVGKEKEEKQQYNNNRQNKVTNKKNVYEPRGDKYYNLIDKIAEESVNNHEIYTFSGGSASRSTYYELHFIPNHKISENEMKPYAKEITEKIFLELSKYEYKKSSSWATSYPKIRINIHYYNSKNSTYKWIYINVLELKKYKSFEEFYKEYE